MSDELYKLPEIEPVELAEWLKCKTGLVLLDVREADETAYAPLADPRVTFAPLSLLSRAQEQGLPPQVTQEAEVVVFCHLGQRSAQVTYWLNVHLGYQKVYNLRGGIDAYARQVDATVRRY
jgi:rhodanese-related sulfurtransferase